jgi:hypothetical protein
MKCYQGNQSKEDEKGGAFSMNREYDKSAKKLYSENLKGTDHLEHLSAGMSGDNTKMDLKGKGCKGADWIQLPQDRR